MRSVAPRRAGSGREGGIPNIRIAQDSVFVFDTATGAWSDAPPLNAPREECVAQAVGGRVYVFGWNDTVESIAEGEDQWRIEPARCPVTPGGGKVCVCVCGWVRDSSHACAIMRAPCLHPSMRCCTCAGRVRELGLTFLAS